MNTKTLNKISSNSDLKVFKTVKLFIGGEFPRTESGRSFPLYKYKTKNIYAQICQGSRKDLRNAVTATQSSSWPNKTAYLRSQVLYRMAEMMESKNHEFCDLMISTLGYTTMESRKEFELARDLLISNAGWADKYQQVASSINPVAGPHHNFTSPEPVGTVGLIWDYSARLSEIINCISCIITSGNTLVALLPLESSALLAPIAECMATSDLPPGTVNLLTGYSSELAEHFSTHMEIHSIASQTKGKDLSKSIQKNCITNLKRFVGRSESKSNLEYLLDFVEYKTVWHPKGN